MEALTGSTFNKETFIHSLYTGGEFTCKPYVVEKIDWFGKYCEAQNDAFYAVS